MNTYAEYIRFKALKEFYDNLSDEDKKTLASLLENRLPDKKEQPVNFVQCKDPYFRGVSQNIVGDGLYDLGLYVLRRLLGGVRL